MFKQRLKETLIVLFGVPVCMIAFGYLCWLTVKYLPFGEFLEWVRIWFLYAFGAFLAIVFILLLCKFIYWLFIEPYRNHKRNKSV